MPPDSTPALSSLSSQVPEGRARRSTLLSLLTATILAAIICLATVRWYQGADVFGYWARWARASDGGLPWTIYARADDCNYPPLYLYWLTLTEALRHALPPTWRTPGFIDLIKFPSVFAWLAGSLLILRTLPASESPGYARRAALCWVLCPALFINAALWGQIDALLSFGLIASVLLAAARRPLACGIAFGLTLALKAQGAVVLPVLLIYLWRCCGGGRSVANFAGAAIVAWLLACAPMLAAGEGQGVLAAYGKAIGFYNWRELNAYNLWTIADYVDVVIRHVPPKEAFFDTTPFLGPLTSRQVGLILFLAAVAVPLVGLWRRPEAHRLFACAGLTLLAFHVLNTEMHERYIVPGVALLALAAPRSGRYLLLFIAASLTASLMQFQQLQDNWTHFAIASRAIDDANTAGAAMVGAINVLLLLYGLTAYILDLRADKLSPPSPLFHK